MAVVINGIEHEYNADGDLMPVGYEYNIDGDLVPAGTVTPGNMYGDFANRYIPGKEKSCDSNWGKTIDKLFNTIDPLSDATKEECEGAVDKFFQQCEQS